MFDILNSVSTNKNGRPILSKTKIDDIAQDILNGYDSSLNECVGYLDIEDFSEHYLNLDTDYQNLSVDQSILGMMVFESGVVEVYDETLQRKRISVREKTIIIDNSLLDEKQFRRARFTHAHEISHWILHRKLYTRSFPIQLTLFNYQQEIAATINCRSKEIEQKEKRANLKTDAEWIEWQADYLASALLMPKDIFIKTVKMKFKEIGITSSMYCIGDCTEKDSMIKRLIYEIAGVFQVSVTAARIRMTNLNLIKVS